MQTAPGRESAPVHSPYEFGPSMILLFSSYATASDAGAIPATATTPGANARIFNSCSRTTAPDKLAHHRRYGRPAQQRPARDGPVSMTGVTVGDVSTVRPFADVGRPGRPFAPC